MRRASNILYHPAAAGMDRPRNEEDKRVGLARSADPLPAASDCQVDVRLAEELETIRRYVEMASRILATDATVCHRHPAMARDLQNAQKVLGQLAAIVAAADKDAAIERIALPELKARMLRKPIRPMFESAH
jgi:hypothetical protein